MLFSAQHLQLQLDKCVLLNVSIYVIAQFVFCLHQLHVSSPVWAWGNPPNYPFTYPPSTLSFSIFYVSLSDLLHLFSCFSISSHSTRKVPLRFQAGCRRRWL